ncbi:MAG: hypothetical protein AAF431_06590 [Pseudomonadota bacterium]
MSAKPSRSELETALAGRSRPAKRRKSASTSKAELQLDSMTARRQKVIGGNLTGVSKRPKRGRLGDAGGINYVNWVAGAIVLMILGVFFWPHESNDVTKEVSGKIEIVRSAPYYTESRVDEQAVPDEQSFMRPTDLERAADFREQEAREKAIQALFADADAHLANGEYLSPQGDNAITAYEQILEIEPRNVKARQGIEYISGRFLSNGYLALENNSESEATAALQRLQQVDPESDEALEFSAALDDWKKQRQIGRLLAQANEAESEERLILPARENALYFYQQILELEQDNTRANSGIKGITDSFIAKANAAVLAGSYEAATGYLATVSVIDPGNPSVTLIEDMITKAKPIAAETQSRAPRRTASRSNAERSNSQARPQPLPTASQIGSVSNNRTPTKEANEQATFDREYLRRGLDAYYKGDYETAAALLQPLADKGVSRAQFRIGYMYYLGRGFDRDRKEADRVIRAALPAIQKFADEGRGWAQSDLGSLYEDGLVLPRDYSEAVYWYRSAAEQGYPGAQTNLGIMYARGRGVTTNRRTAIEWFQRAAKQGDIVAKRNLEVMGKEP